MDLDEIFEKIKNKEITICETCDTIFAFVPMKEHCNECRRKRMTACRWRWMQSKYRQNEPSWWRAKKILD